MHEYAVTQEIVRIVEEAARGAGAGVKVTRVILKIGKFSAVVVRYVQHYYDMMTEGTNLHGAEIDAVEVAATAECGECGRVYEVIGPDSSCPGCGGPVTTLLTGRELLVESIEVNDI